MREAKVDPEKMMEFLAKSTKSPDYKFTDTDLLSIMKDTSTSLKETLEASCARMSRIDSNHKFRKQYTHEQEIAEALDTIKNPQIDILAGFVKRSVNYRSPV